MTTQAIATKTKTEIDLLWDVLENLSWNEIPTDLTEIDENWCYNRILEYCAGELEEMLERASYENMACMASDLRDIWHDARAEDAQYLSGRW